jgi:site-specific DNA-methyltransferase (adenine-specific)
MTVPMVRERWFPDATGPRAHLVVGAAAAFGVLCRALGQAPALIYADPPYLSGRAYAWTRRWSDGDGAAHEEQTAAFDDRWPGGPETYFAAMDAAFAACASALDPEGSLLVHVDPRVGPRIATLLDALLGEGDRFRRGTFPGFRNELVWTYGLGGSSGRIWARKHDTIFWYTRGARWFYEPPRVAARSVRMRGQTKKATDVIDVASINNMARERSGWPTQKPLELLDLLVRAHAPSGSLVGDPFVGSGTTALAAVRHGCSFIGSDQSEDSVRLARARLVREGVGLQVCGTRPHRPHPNAAVARLGADGTLLWDDPVPAEFVAVVTLEPGDAIVGHALLDASPGHAGRRFLLPGSYPRDTVPHLLVRDARGDEFLCGILAA